MGLVREAIGDALLTSMWVFSLPIRGVTTSVICSYLDVDPKSLPTGLFVKINVATLFVIAFSVMGGAMGGASFNPSTTMCLYVAGLKKSGYSLTSMAVRFPAQAAGGVGGALAVLQVMPGDYRHMLRGPTLKVDLHKGFVAEGLITFFYCLALLVVMLRGPRMFLVKVWLVAVVTAGLVMLGRDYTGPSINPANAYGWAYVNNWHNSWELFYVYWVGSFIGAAMAAWVFKLMFKPPQVKQKET